jgi:RNA polymerase sigma-70 factor, ECF subfamily
VSEADFGISPTNEPTARTVELLNLLGPQERSLFAYVYALTPNWQDAEEVMQEVRLRVWQQFDQYDPAKPFGCWVRAIAYYAVLTYRKKTNREREFFGDHLLKEVSDTYEALVDGANERRAALRCCLDKLSERKRRVIEVYYLSTEPAAKIAENLSLSQNALRQLLFRIRKTLFECVERTIRSEMGN